MKDLSYGWNNGRMMKTALKSINDESLRLMELISYEDKLPDWTLAKVSTALDRLTMARQHIQSMIELGYTPNPGIMEKIKKTLGFASKTGVKAAKQAARFTSDRAIDAKHAMSISSVQKKIDNLRACAKALEISDVEMKNTRRYKELILELESTKRARTITVEKRRTRKKNPRRKRKAGILRPRGEGFNEARQAFRDEYREKHGPNWWKDKSLKDEMYDRLRDMGY